MLPSVRDMHLSRNAVYKAIVIPKQNKRHPVLYYIKYTKEKWLHVWYLSRMLHILQDRPYISNNFDMYVTPKY